MENASVGAAPQEILYDLNSVNLPDVDNAIFRDNDESANFLPDIIQPYLPPYPNPSRNPSVFQNSTNSTFEYLFYFTPTLNNIFILACLAICTIWCIVMNLLIIGALWKGHERDKEHVTDMYLINLAFADVLLGFLVFPFMSIVILVGYFPLSATWCNIWVYFDYYLIIATSYGFAALMCSFLVMLKWPEYYPKSKKLHLVFLLLVWILSNAPWTAPFFHDRVSFIYPTGVCGFSIQKNRYFTFYIGFTGLYIPLAIALVAGIFAVKYLKQSARAPFLKLLLKNDSCHVHPFVPSSASDSEFNGLQNIRRGNGVSRTQYMRPMPAGLSPSALPNESSDSSGSSNRPPPNQTKRRSVINISTFHRNKALQDSVRKHFPLVATSLILFVLCRSFFYVYFGIGSILPELFPPDLSHSVYWVMHSYAVLAPIVHLVLDKDVRRSVVRFINEGSFRLPPFSGAVDMSSFGNATSEKQRFDHVLPKVSVIDTIRQQQRVPTGGEHNAGKLSKNGQIVRSNDFIPA